MEEERSSAGFGLERERSDTGFGLEQERRGGGFEIEEERSGTRFRLEQERSGGGLRGEERSGASHGSTFLFYFGSKFDDVLYLTSKMRMHVTKKCIVWFVSECTFKLYYFYNV